MAFELLILVKILDWRHRREEERRLRPFRERTRELLAQSADRAAQDFAALAVAMEQCRSSWNAEKDVSPAAPVEPRRVLKSLKSTSDQLGRDAIGSYTLFDDASEQMTKAAMKIFDDYLRSWPARGLLRERLVEDWGSEDGPMIADFGRAARVARQAGWLMMEVSGTLFSCNPTNEPDPAVASAEIRKTARQLLDGTHGLYVAFARDNGAERPGT